MEIVIFKKDNLKLGMVYGLLAPIIAMVLYYFLVLADKITFSEFLFYLRSNKSLLTGVSSISLVANAIVFTIFVNTRRDKSARGVFVTTLIYGLAVLLIKVIA